MAAAEEAKSGQVVGMDIGMRWNPALHELRRLAVMERDLGELKSARLTLAFKQWPREWQVISIHGHRMHVCCVGRHLRGRSQKQEVVLSFGSLVKVRQGEC